MRLLSRGFMTDSCWVVRRTPPGAIDLEVRREGRGGWRVDAGQVIGRLGTGLKSQRGLGSGEKWPDWVSDSPETGFAKGLQVLEPPRVRAGGCICSRPTATSGMQKGQRERDWPPGSLQPGEDHPYVDGSASPARRHAQREIMKRIAIGLTLLVLATSAGANGIQGNVLKTNGLPVWPCDIDITNRDTGQPVIVTSDSTLPNGHYDLVLPDGRYNLLFKPRIGQHVFQGFLQDQRVQANTITSNITLAMGQYALGKVVDKNGAGVPCAATRSRAALGSPPNQVQDNGTNADGTFNTLVTAGTYTVEIIPANADHKAPVDFPSQNLTVDDNLGNVLVQDGWVL